MQQVHCAAFVDCLFTPTGVVEAKGTVSWPWEKPSKVHGRRGIDWPGKLRANMANTGWGSLTRAADNSKKSRVRQAPLLSTPHLLDTPLYTLTAS